MPKILQCSNLISFGCCLVERIRTYYAELNAEYYQKAFKVILTLRYSN